MGKCILLLIIFGCCNIYANTQDFMIEEPIRTSTDHVLDVGIQQLIVNSFYNTTGIGIGYNRKFNEQFQWSAIKLDRYFGTEKGLSTKIYSDLKVVLDTPPVIKQILSTQLIYSPLDFKWIYKNQKTIWSQLQITLGAGTSEWSDHKNRLMLSSGLKFNFDFDYNAQANSKYYWSITNMTYIDKNIEGDVQLGIGFLWGI